MSDLELSGGIKKGQGPCFSTTFLLSKEKGGGGGKRDGERRVTHKRGRRGWAREGRWQGEWTLLNQVRERSRGR